MQANDDGNRMAIAQFQGNRYICTYPSIDIVEGDSQNTRDCDNEQLVIKNCKNFVKIIHF